MRLVLLAALLVVALPALVSAQEPANEAIEAARVALDEGDLLGAGTAVDRALSSDVLDREQLRDVLVLRALLSYADDRLGMLEESLEALAMLEGPEPTAFPPPLRTRYREIVAVDHAIALDVELVTDVLDDRRTVRVVPVAHGDAGHLVRELRVTAAVGEGPLAAVSPDAPLLAGDPHAEREVHWTVQALGPGGVVIASRGAPEAPETSVLAALPVDHTFLHVAIVTGAAVIVAAAIAVTIAAFATDGFTAGQPTTIAPIGCSGAPCPAPLISF